MTCQITEYEIEGLALSDRLASVSLLLQAVRPELERQLPTSLLHGVRGLALLSVMRVGAGWSCTAGTGLVVARQRNGTW
jgi:lipid-binding SYLF domain-containing protein